MTSGRCAWCYGAEEYYNCVCENEEGVFLCKNSAGCGHTPCNQCETPDYEESVGC